jgi:thiosulfate/3-mercaptopyruvate sulfurtransferase
LKHIIHSDWLLSRLNDSNLRIIDCRFQLGNPSFGLNEYMKEHIQGAIFYDLEKDLSGTVKDHGGRHPLPSIDELADKLSATGIDETTTVVAYDDQGGAFASRLWWILTYLGHRDVFILDGGYSSWKEKGNPVSDEIPTFNRTDFSPSVNDSMIADINAVREAINTNSSVLIDSREKNRYLGIEEPIDKIAGHIPGAVNSFWKEGLTELGEWKEPNEQNNRFSSTAQKDDEIIVYCGSGITACPNIVALSEAGYKNVKLYSGSWSDWISYPENPIEK